MKRHWYRVSHSKHLYFLWDTLYVRNVQLYYIYSREKMSYPSLPRALENRTDGVGGDVMRSLTALTPLNFWDLHNKNLKQFTLKANFYHYSPPPHSDVTLTPLNGKGQLISKQNCWVVTFPKKRMKRTQDREVTTRQFSFEIYWPIDSAKFWITWLKLMRKAGHLQLIQNSAP